MTKTETPTPYDPADLITAIRALPGQARLLGDWPDAALVPAIERCIDVLAAHPAAAKADTARLAHQVWDTIRDQPCGPRGAALAVVLRDGAVNNITIDLQSLIGALETLRRQHASVAAVLARLGRAAGKGTAA